MNRIGLRRLLVVTAIVAWVLVVLAAYYAVHKPFSAESMSRIAGTSLDLVLASWINVVACALGAWLLRRTPVQSCDRLERVSLAWPLGLGALALLSLGMGVARIWHSLVALGVLATLTLLLRVTPRRLSVAAKDLVAQTWGAGSHGLWGYVLVVAALGVIVGLMPPYAWDATVYHLTGPQSYVEAARLVPPESSYLALPQNVEMLYTLAMLLGSDRIPQLLHLSFAFSTGLLVYVWLRRLLSPGAAVWGLVIFAAMPEVSRLAPWAYVDMAVASFAMAAAFCTARWAHDAQPSWLILAGAYAGLGMGTKYLAVVWAIGLLPVVLWKGLRTRSPVGELVRTVGVYAGVGVLVLLPWLIRGLVTMGNPVYPFIFGGRLWNDLRAAWVMGTSRGLPASTLSYLLIPWSATVMGVSGGAGFEADIGPLLLVLAPLALIVRRRPADVNLLLWLVGCEWAAMAICVSYSSMMLQTRLFIAALPFLAIVAAWALDATRRWRSQAFSVDRVLRAVIVLAAALSLLSTATGVAAQAPLGYLLGARSSQQQLERTLGSLWAAMQAVEAEVPPDGKVIMLWEPRGYYCPRACINDPTLDNLPQALDRARDADGIAREWREAGITHVLLSRRGLDFILATDQYPLRDADVIALSELIRAHLTDTRAVDGDFKLYRLQ
jgi:hypothetical protein